MSKELMKNKPLVFEPHYYQQLVLESTKPIILAVSGIQGGKTSAGVMWIAMNVEKYPGDNFLVAAPTFKILEQSTMDKFFSMIPESVWGKYSKQERCLYLKTGGKVYFRSVDDPNALEGVTCRGAWLDEAGNMKHMAFVNALGRVSAKYGQVLMTTTPYTSNWMLSDIYEPWEQAHGNHKDIDVIQFRSVDNPYFTKESARLAQANLSPAEYERRYLGKFRMGQGRVYEDAFDVDGRFREGTIILREKVPALAYVVAGIDWGFRDPLAITVVGVTVDSHVVVLAEWYKSQMSDDEIVTKCQELQLKYKISIFYADYSEPGKIDLLNRNGVPCTKANKEIAFGIGRVRTLMRTQRFHIVSGTCPNLEEEAKMYMYDLVESKAKGIEIPFAGNDHALDTIRYVCATHQGIETIIQMTQAPVKSGRAEVDEFWSRVHEEIAEYQEQKENLAEELFGEDDGYDYINGVFLD